MPNPIAEPHPNQVVLFDADLTGHGDSTIRLAAIRHIDGWKITGVSSGVERLTWQQILNLAGDQPIHLCLSWRVLNAVHTPGTTPTTTA